MKTKFISIFILFFVSLLAVRSFPLTIFFPSQDDATPLRQQELHKCTLDFQVPCRWVPDMASGNGYPLFNYYPPLPYMVGEPFMLIGLSQYASVKISFFLSLFLSGIAIYFLCRHIFNDTSGLVAGVFYIWAPYRAVDIYVRGALNESWSFVFIPLILLFSYKLLTEGKKQINIPLLAFSLSGLFLSHNVIVLIFLPFYIFWIIAILFISKSFKNMISVALGSILGLGIASFFTIPAFLEKNLVWLDFTNGYFDFRNHFLYFSQLFVSRDWGYGMSFEGPGDGMSFQIGHLLYLFAAFSILITLFSLIFSWITKKELVWTKNNFVGIITFALAVFAVFMSTDFSQFVWQLFPILSIVQFPWRFLTLITFFLSVASAYFIFQLKHGLSRIISAFAIIAIISLNWNYFLPDNTNIYRSDSLAGGNLKDYLPLTSPDGPPGTYNGDLVSAQGNYFYEVSKEKFGSNWFTFNITVKDYTPLIINRLQFPNWKISVDNQLVKSEVDSTGRLLINIPPGNHMVRGNLKNTPIRNLSNTVSLVSIIGSLVFLGYSLIQYKNES